MKKAFILAFSLIFISGCISLCPSSCDDSNPCTSDRCDMLSCSHEILNGSQNGCDTLAPPCRMQSCIAGACELKNISGCCGNGLCESNEDISNCAADCSASIKLECNSSDTLVPILLKLEDELDTQFIYCTITNNGTAEKEVVFTSEIPGWSENFTKTLSLYPGVPEYVHVLPVWKDKLYTNTEEADASLVSRIESSGVTVASDTQSVKISPKEDIVWTVSSDGEQISLYHSLSAWVTPHDTCVSSLISKAKELAPGRSLGGYANYDGLSEEEKANKTLSQARAIFYSIKGQGVSYVNTPVSFSGSQRVKMPADSLAEKSGNCVDGSVLFASAFEALGMRPVIVIIPQHTFVGVETYQNSSRYIFIETTLVGSGSFEEAVNEGSDEYNEYKNSSQTIVIDITEYRANITPFQSYVNCTLNATCSDGTSAGACTKEKPELCTGSGFIDAATVCGCPSGYIAKGDSCYSSILKNETFVLDTSYGNAYFWGPNLPAGSFRTYRYAIISSSPIQIYIVPSKSDYNNMRSGNDFTYYPVYKGTNTLSYDQTVYQPSDGGVLLYNDGHGPAIVTLEVFAVPG